MDTSVYKRFKAMHTLPYWLLCVTCVISVALAAIFWLYYPVIWLIAFIVIAAWTPLIFHVMRSIYRKYGVVAFLFILVVAQTLHFFEHASQMIEIHMLGLSGPSASGIISALNTEWVHFIWNSWVLVFAFFLMFSFSKNRWLWMLFIFAIWHEIEHAYIMSVYLRTHISGTPGLIARGGAIGGGLPITRPDLHFLYAVIEETLLLLAYFYEIRRLQEPAGNAVLNTNLA